MRGKGEREESGAEARKGEHAAERMQNESNQHEF